MRCASNVHSQDTAGPQEKDIGGATRWPCGTTHRSVESLRNHALVFIGLSEGESTEGLSPLPIHRCRTILNLAITVHPCSQQSAFFP